MLKVSHTESADLPLNCRRNSEAWPVPSEPTRHRALGNRRLSAAVVSRPLKASVGYLSRAEDICPGQAMALTYAQGVGEWAEALPPKAYVKTVNNH
jgi:hypothetical protein